MKTVTYEERYMTHTTSPEVERAAKMSRVIKLENMKSARSHRNALILKAVTIVASITGLAILASNLM